MAERLAPIPPNLELISDRINDDFRALIIASKAVIMPIVDPNVMSGHLVSIQAMQSSKPVFISRNNFIREWIGDLDDVSFLEMYDTLESLRDILLSLDDKALQKKGAEGRRYLLAHFTEEAFYDELAEIVLGALDEQHSK
jgi:glycosyltransferase involved in cell wall biosynthesis